MVGCFKQLLVLLHIQKPVYRAVVLLTQEGLEHVSIATIQSSQVLWLEHACGHNRHVHATQHMHAHSLTLSLSDTTAGVMSL